MSNMPTDYAFGHTEHEMARLSTQGRMLAPFTRSVFAAAGIGPGAKVIDLGCGGGDVSLLLAQMVGPAGRVLALDNAPEALAATKARAEIAGCLQIKVKEADLSHPPSLALPEGYDAAVGRLILHYVSQPAALIARIAAAVRPGGALAFIEYDMSTAATNAVSPLLTRVVGWYIEAIRYSGFDPDTGSKLFGLFAEAGLRAELATETVVSGGADGPVLAMCCDVVRTLLPKIVASGAATEAEVDIDTLAERLRTEPGADRRTTYMPRMTGAWAHTAFV